MYRDKLETSRCFYCFHFYLCITVLYLELIYMYVCNNYKPVFSRAENKYLHGRGGGGGALEGRRTVYSVKTEFSF